MNRRAIARVVTLATAGVVFGFLTASPADAQLRRETVVQGLTAPVVIAADPLTGGFLVAQQDGVVRAVVAGVAQSTPFLNLSTVVRTGGEQGLLGLAIDPRDPLRVFVNFTDRTGVGNTVIARFQRAASNPLVAIPNSRFDLQFSAGRRFIEQPHANHNGGNLVFGPDGYLYIGMGDGGSGNDPDNYAQNPASLLGKMLRIDVNVPDTDPRGYTIPPGNPFLPFPQALPEIWAFGYRNPWRFSFDDFGSGRTDAMIVGDVGQGAYEEIDYEPAGRGGRNYGWRVREGAAPNPNLPPQTPAYGPLTDPIAHYPGSIGHAVTGGYVYRGTALPPQYQGRYFVADFVSGRVFSLGLALNGQGEATVTTVLEHTAELGRPSGISTFGRGPDGELYFASFNGSIYRIAANVAGAPPVPANLRAAVSGSTVTLAWDPGAGGGPVLGYQVEAGVQPGQSNIVITQTAATQFVVGGVPPGTYYVKVRSGNAAGLSQPTPEVPVTVSCPTLPAPTNYVTQVGTLAASLSWNPVPGAIGYQVEAGSAPGQADLAVFHVSTAALGGPAPARTYYTRVRAINACGLGAASVERQFTIPQ